ncbi:FbpB family small basic protein [Pseudalkalibacillus caeni]|uniref:FbpB family small basic protein n=1 Tax=Exobacillus caeni TaxID=2574798 RepID=A0A5R9FCZ5_9BACL|nr:FbpB family small basic protein [Pseudalkalibacillus caeni]TLS38743.1 FbpB family small basic protein [Pseudalkalibacillus caeni]
MRKRKSLTFKQLVDKNKADLLKDKKELEKIEKRIERKHA